MTRADRVRDTLSLALVVVGGACYTWAYLGMKALRDAQHDPSATVFAGYVRWQRLTQLSYVAIAAIVLGVLVGVFAALRAREAAKARNETEPSS